MPLHLGKITINDDVGLLAKTCTSELFNADPLPAPDVEFALVQESAHTTATDLRPDGSIVEIMVAADGNPSAVAFKGCIEYMDDMSDPDLDRAIIDMSALPQGQGYRQRLTKIFASNNATMGASTLPGTSADGEHSGIQTSMMAHDIIKSLAKEVGLVCARLDFPNYKVIGDYPIENETVLEVAARLVQPFNIFDFRKHLVRLNGDVLSVVKFDYIDGISVPNPYECEKASSHFRTFRKYASETIIGNSTVVLTGGMAPDTINKRVDPVILNQPDIPQMVDPDDASLGATTLEFKMDVLMQEKEIVDTVKTTSSNTPNQDNPGGNGSSPDPDGRTLVEVEVESLARVLLVGYDSTLPAKLVSAQAIMANLAAYAEFLGFAPASAVISFMKLEYPSLSDEELLQKAQQRYGRVVRKREEFESIVDQLTEASLTTVADDVPGEVLNDPDERLSYIDPSDTSAEPVYGAYDPATDTYAIISVVLKNNVAYGDVKYIQSLSTLFTGQKKITTLQYNQGENDNGLVLKKEKIVINDFTIAKYGYEKRMITRHSTEENYVYNAGLRIPDQKDVRSYIFDPRGNVAQTTIEHYVNMRDEWMWADTDVDMDVLGKLEYALQAFEDGRRTLVPALKAYEVAKTRRDIRENLHDGQAGPHIAHVTSPDLNILAQWTETLERVPIGHYMLVDGKQWNEERFMQRLMRTIGSISYLSGGSMQGDLHSGDNVNVSSAGDIVDLPDSPLKSIYRLNFSNMDLAGLKEVWKLCQKQKELEQSACYWEISTVTIPYDTAPTSGITILSRGSTGISESVQSEITENSALTTIRHRKLVLNKALPRRVV